MQTKRKILLITPRFPSPEAGADEQDRAEGIRHLRHLGYDVRVIAKYFDWQDPHEIRSLWKDEGVDVTLVPYQQKKKWLFLLTHPWYLDGAAAEYAEQKIRSAVQKALSAFKPDLVWFDYTYLWPLYALARERGIPIVVRSINIESRHFLDEDGRTLINYLKYIPKYVTEKITGQRADVLFSITPYEQALYQRMKAVQVVNLPLRALWKKLGTHTPRQTDHLNIFFSGSTYTVHHNRRALEFIVKELAPACAMAGEPYTFFITGAKFPDDLRPFIKDNIRFVGFVKDMDGFLGGMDIAVVPSFFGAGMQQKIFEPLSRGFPTVTNHRGLAGYDFVPGGDVLTAETVKEYMGALKQLQSYGERQRLSGNAKRKSAARFSRDVLDGIVSAELEKIFSKNSSPL